jgi:ABC-type uncharacterized transport system ATPase subunit
MNVNWGLRSVQTPDPSVPAVRLERLTKRFDDLVASDNITLDFKRGEVHALLGENGAGKTTLMNLLYGMYRRDAGKIYRDGVEVEIRSSRDAICCGIGMIHQNFMLVPTLGVLDNIVLGLESVGFRIDRKRLSAEINCVASRYGIEIDLDAKVWQLSVGEQQRVELVKILYRNVDFLILDEPTAVLTPGETKRLFEMMRRITASGGAVVFISHKLEEVLEVADRVSVLRHGRLVGTVERGDTDKTELTRMMIGRPIWEAVPRIPSDPRAKEIITATNLRCLNEKGLPALRGVSFRIREGEILGLAGVAGNGQRELLEALSGLRKLEDGEVWIQGTNLTNKSVRELDAFGVCHIPEDRALFGTIGQFDISENLILNTFWKPPYSAHGLLRRDAIMSHCKELVKKYDVRSANLMVNARLLSGGNLQKLILARELDKNPKLLLAGQPTRGLDIGATQYVRNEIMRQKAKGTAVLLVSDDLQDILALSDRIAVMYEGRIVGEMTPENLDLDRLGSMMAGTSRAEVNV